MEDEEAVEVGSAADERERDRRDKLPRSDRGRKELIALGVVWVLPRTEIPTFGGVALSSVPSDTIRPSQFLFCLSGSSDPRCLVVDCVAVDTRLAQDGRRTGLPRGSVLPSARQVPLQGHPLRLSAHSHSRAALTAS